MCYELIKYDYILREVGTECEMQSLVYLIYNYLTIKLLAFMFQRFFMMKIQRDMTF
jgi:hypothetical protein